MSRATVELDFFGMERDSSSSSSSLSSGKSQFQKFLHRQRSFRGGIQNAMSKINPEILKSVISSGGSVNNAVPNPAAKSISLQPSPTDDRSLFPALPVLVPNERLSSFENVHETTPLTIFYNGSVSVFNVPREKAESILKIAVQGSSKQGIESKQPSTPLTNQSELIDSLNGDLPIARRKSLQRFLEKRKERLISVSPYGCDED